VSNEIVNGFEIIEDLGVVYKEGSRNKTHYVMAICKHCKKTWKTSYYTLNVIKGCGCTRPSQLKPLPEYVHGFKVINDIGYLTDKGYRWATVECKVCGKEYDVDPNKLKYRNHCGCMKKGVIASRYAKSHPQLTMAIKHMMGRCYNKNNQDYYNYGARGITICDEWLADRNAFFEWSIEHGFEEGKALSIDRIDSTKGYSPENCRWTTALVQGRNTRRNVLDMDIVREIRSRHEENPSVSTVQLANEYKVSKSTIWLVIHNRIWKE